MTELHVLQNKVMRTILNWKPSDKVSVAKMTSIAVNQSCYPAHTVANLGINQVCLVEIHTWLKTCRKFARSANRS